jgi:hypothetical protein
LWSDHQRHAISYKREACLARTSTVRGTLGTVTGSVTLDETDITKSSVEATIDAAGMLTRDGMRDEHLEGCLVGRIGRRQAPRPTAPPKRLVP